jgi:hypothetical protein
MKKLVMLLVVLALCVPSFGATAVLVYKVNITQKPMIVDGNEVSAVENYGVAAKVRDSITAKGWLVFEVNAVTLETVYDTNGVTDVNRTPTLVLNYKDPETGVKLTQVMKSDDMGISRLITVEKKPKKYGMLWTDSDFEGVVDPNNDAWVDGFGKLTATKLVKGSDIKVEVPKSLKGDGNFERFIGTTNIPFSCPVAGTLKLTLDTGRTQKANAAILKVKAVADLLD